MSRPLAEAGGATPTVPATITLPAPSTSTSVANEPGRPDRVNFRTPSRSTVTPLSVNLTSRIGSSPPCPW